MRYFLLDTKTETGTLFFRVVKRNPSLNIRISTGIKVDVAAWQRSQASISAWDKYCHTEKGKVVSAKLSAIDEAVSNLMSEGEVKTNADKPIIEAAVNMVVNADAIRMEREQKELARKKELEQQRNILNFYKSFMEGVDNGTVKHGDSESYRASTIGNWKSFGIHLNGYCKKNDTFDGIDKKYADRFCAYMERKGVMPSTINKYVICFRRLCNIAAEYGVNRNATSLKVWKERRVDEDTKRTEIYLTSEEIDAIYAYPFDGIDAEARDLFMLGCMSCQRYSDYGTLTKENFGTNINGTPVIMVKQTKTGNYVEIPIIDDRIFEICEKYDYHFPRINSRRINDYLQVCMKKVAAVCPSLNEAYTTNLTQQEHRKEQHYSELSKKVADGMRLTKEEARTFRNMEAYAAEHNGQPLYGRNADGDAIKFKWELITTHTARRSGVTNLYKTGILDTREMMAISGHQTEKVFEEYIKVGASEMADRIAAKLRAARTNNK